MKVNFYRFLLALSFCVNLFLAFGSAPVEAAAKPSGQNDHTVILVDEESYWMFCGKPGEGKFETEQFGTTILHVFCNIEDGDIQ